MARPAIAPVFGYKAKRSRTRPKEARQDLTLIRNSSPGMMVYEISLSVMGAIAREAGEFKQAERYLLSSIKAAKAKKGDQILCGACFHIARLYFAWGDMEKGHQCLKQAMDLAVSHRYFMFWDIHMATMVEMALRSMKYGYYANHAEEMLIKFFDHKTAEYLLARAQTIDESQITAFCDDFVATYQRDGGDQRYFVKASLFGKPEISVNGTRIPDTEWKTKKVKGLLEYLLLGSGSTISKEVLAETFWPGCDGKSALASLRTALYHLRKVLAKYNAEVAGPKAFIFETREGFQIKGWPGSGARCPRVLTSYKETSQPTALLPKPAKTSRTSGKNGSSIKGDLMEGNDYGDLVLVERERLKTIYIEACQKLSSFFVKSGEHSKAEDLLRNALAAEPYNENVCLDLLDLYMSQGKNSRATKLYYSFKKRLDKSWI